MYLLHWKVPIKKSPVLSLSKRKTNAAAAAEMAKELMKCANERLLDGIKDNGDGGKLSILI